MEARGLPLFVDCAVGPPGDLLNEVPLETEPGCRHNTTRIKADDVNLRETHVTGSKSDVTIRAPLPDLVYTNGDEATLARTVAGNRKLMADGTLESYRRFGFGKDA